jgi:hypothetical protein
MLGKYYSYDRKSSAAQRIKRLLNPKLVHPPSGQPMGRKVTSIRNQKVDRIDQPVVYFPAVPVWRKLASQFLYLLSADICLRDHFCDHYWGRTNRICWGGKRWTIQTVSTGAMTSELKETSSTSMSTYMRKAGTQKNVLWSKCQNSPST